MRAINKITISLVAGALLMVGCGTDGLKSSEANVATKTVTEESLGLRKTDIYTEDSTIAVKTEYGTAQATTSTKIRRAFQDAPPMIPHDTIGMLPIKSNDNRCVSCHLPEVADSVGATPIPVSHFTDFRPRAELKDGEVFIPVNNYKNEVSIKKGEELQNARFNCTQCHAPQSQGNLVVENTFEAVYTSKDGASRSNWKGSTLTDSLDTVIGGDSFITEKDIANKNSAAGGGSEHH
ncbi:nitrate reductase cytochrome c-type subunit [Sulfurimonas sp.]|uniref:nitrate reductase cytochrome c-type subunit n=1 Tax=Sulfurimonas sp. TaxID=2022749 RepID=UPI0025E91199|nr:nitrate reductase cytochrome c-type subunit [Sulfurimonas sp.]MDD5158255.1 nitrate reductase cytochrome c-type subunit [Sulfurimonas sp.]